jgi:hypothetical protein
LLFSLAIKVWIYRDKAVGHIMKDMRVHETPRHLKLHGYSSGLNSESKLNSPRIEIRGRINSVNSYFIQLWNIYLPHSPAHIYCILIANLRCLLETQAFISAC